MAMPSVYLFSLSVVLYITLKAHIIKSHYYTIICLNPWADIVYFMPIFYQLPWAFQGIIPHGFCCISHAHLLLILTLSECKIP